MAWFETAIGHSKGDCLRADGLAWLAKARWVCCLVSWRRRVTFSRLMLALFFSVSPKVRRHSSSSRSVVWFTRSPSGVFHCAPSSRGEAFFFPLASASSPGRLVVFIYFISLVHILKLKEGLCNIFCILSSYTCGYQVCYCTAWDLIQVLFP